MTWRYIENSEILAVLKKAGESVSFPELTDLTEQLSAQLTEREASAAAQVAEARAKVGKFFKVRDYSADRPSFAFSPDDDPMNPHITFCYVAVTGCNERGELRAWSFSTNQRGTVSVEQKSMRGIFASLGAQEIDRETFYAAASEAFDIVMPLLTGEVA